MSISWPKVRVQLLKVFSRFSWAIMLVSVVIVFGLGYLWFIRGGWEEIRTRRRYNLLQTQTQANYLEGHFADLRRLSEQLSRVNREQLARFTTVLPAEPDVPGLLVQIAEIAKQSGLLVNSIQFSNVEASAAQPGGGSDEAVLPEQRPMAELETVAINLSVSRGNYAKLKQFLTNLESSLRLIDVATVNFSGSDETTFSIAMQAYYWTR